MQLFTIKYKPRKLDQIVGQRRGITELLDFLKNFPKQRAVIIYGPPGIGKTAVVYALANQFDYELVNVDSSTLTKENEWKIKGIFSGSLFGKKKIIFIDEVDNVSSISRIVNLVKTATIPVIMTANDAYDPRIRRLREISKLIEFKRIRKDIIVSYLKTICERERIRVNEKEIRKIAEDSEGDLRAALNDLYIYLVDKKKIESYRLTQKNIFNALRNLFDSRSLDEIDVGDIDFDTIFQWIVENVENVYDKKGTEKMFEFLSISDLFNGLIKRKQYFPLKYYSHEIAFLGVLASSKHRKSGFTRLYPPKRINYLFKTKKKREEVMEKIEEFFGEVKCSRYKIEKYYLPFLDLWTEHF